MFYYLCKNPRCYNQVVREIDEMDHNGDLSDPITFAESNKLKYLQACMKEAMRLHPAVGQLLERVVPEGGSTIAGTWLPAGVIVGVNPWVISRDKTVYGDDFDQYRPERWLEADAASLKLMERNFLAVSVLNYVEIKASMLTESFRIVRIRRENMPGQEHISTRDVEARSADPTTLPNRAVGAGQGVDIVGLCMESSA